MDILLTAVCQRQALQERQLYQKQKDVFPYEQNTEKPIRYYFWNNLTQFTCIRYGNNFKNESDLTRLQF